MLYKDLEPVKSTVNERFNTLKQRFPNLRAYLVWSSRFGSVEIKASSAEAITKFPAMFLESELRDTCTDLVKKAKKLESALKHMKDLEEKSCTAKTIAEYQKDIQAKAELLDVDQDVYAEICFHELEYNLIDKLKEAPEIDPDSTPRTRASIRISFGMIRNLLESNSGTSKIP